METPVSRSIPGAALAFGVAGLLPPAAGAVSLLALPVGPVRDVAWVTLVFYGALIFSFLGGTWWAFAAPDPRPRWLLAAVAPSLIALVLLVMVLGATTRAPAVTLLALAVLASPAVDAALGSAGLTPAWWLRLRVPLSVGLALCLAVAAWRVPLG